MYNNQNSNRGGRNNNRGGGGRGGNNRSDSAASNNSHNNQYTGEHQQLQSNRNREDYVPNFRPNSSGANNYGNSENQYRNNNNSGHRGAGQGEGSGRGGYNQNREYPSRQYSGASNYNDANIQYTNNNNPGRGGHRGGYQRQGGGYNRPDYSNNQIVLKDICKQEIQEKLNKYDYVDLSTVRGKNPHALVFKKRNGQIMGLSAKFMVNHFNIDFPNYEFNLFRVDISKTNLKERESKEVNKKTKRILMDKVIRENIKSPRDTLIFFDGDTLLFIQRTSFEFQGMDLENEKIDKKSYKCKISTTNLKIQLADLKRFLNGDEGFNSGLVHPSIQAINLLSKSMLLAAHFQNYGNFYFDPNLKFDLQDGHVIFKGFNLNARPSGKKMALVVNTSGLVMPKELNILKYIEERFKIEIKDIASKKDFIKSEISDIKVKLLHIKKYNKSIIINSLDRQETALTKKFDYEGKSITIAQYFKDKHKKDLQYPDLPLVVEKKKDLKTNEIKINYYPLEVCEVMAVKSNVRESAEMKSKVIEETKEGPFLKHHGIMNNLNDVLNKADYRSIQFNISRTMKEANGFILPVPQLQYGNKILLLESKEKRREGCWNINDKTFFKPTSISKTIAINFTSTDTGKLKVFFKNLKEMSVEKNMIWSTETVIENSDQKNLIGTFKKIHENSQKWDIVFFIMDKKDPFHDAFKTISEVGFGLRSICILKKNLESTSPRFGDILRNLCLKINERLNGINHVLIQDNNIKEIFSKPIMFISADVSHPGTGLNGFPSVAAVVGSMDQYAKKYICRMRAQWHQRSTGNKENKSCAASAQVEKETVANVDELEKESGSAQEVIVDFKSIVKDLLQAHISKSNKIIPQRIIYYRDGVSEGQFGIVLDKELSMIKEAIKEVIPEKESNIKITFITVQKRHNTRIFKSDLCEKINYNPQPGTVISEICHPTESESYLLSHQMNGQATAKPSHYKCLYDESDFNETQLNIMHFYLSHLFARCNRSVKIPTPVYYADLASTRGMTYLKMATDKEWREKALEQFKNGQIQYFDIPIHENIKDELFFI
jgi:eukaryotic translation initiation factor 2C